MKVELCSFLLLAYLRVVDAFNCLPIKTSFHLFQRELKSVKEVWTSRIQTMMKMKVCLKLPFNAFSLHMQQVIYNFSVGLNDDWFFVYHI